MYGSNGFDRMMREFEAEERHDKFVRKCKTSTTKVKKQNRNHVPKKTRIKHINRRGGR
jgi:hypothetical protein